MRYKPWYQLYCNYTSLFIFYFIPFKIINNLTNSNSRYVEICFLSNLCIKIKLTTKFNNTYKHQDNFKFICMKWTMQWLQSVTDIFAFSERLYVSSIFSLRYSISRIDLKAMNAMENFSFCSEQFTFLITALLQ